MSDIISGYFKPTSQLCAKKHITCKYADGLACTWVQSDVPCVFDKIQSFAVSSNASEIIEELR